jgi:hypothetical protein
MKQKFLVVISLLLATQLTNAQTEIQQGTYCNDTIYTYEHWSEIIYIKGETKTSNTKYWWWYSYDKKQYNPIKENKIEKFTSYNVKDEYEITGFRIQFPIDISTITTPIYLQCMVFEETPGTTNTKNSKGKDYLVIKHIKLNAGEIEWNKTKDTVLDICYDTKIDFKKEIKTLIKPKGNWQTNNNPTGINELLEELWEIKKENNESIIIPKDSINDILLKIITSNNTNQLSINKKVIHHKQEKLEAKSNELILKIHNNKYTKPIELLKNEPIESGDNIYLGFQKETTDSLYTINWLINGKKDSTLTYKNLYQIDKNYTGKLNIKLQATTNLSGCTAYDSVELNVTSKKIDTIYITKTDTIYIEKEPNKTAIINKQTNLNIWPNPTTTFVNAEAEEPFSYTLLNNVGVILKKEEGEPSYTISMSEYPDGIYFIKTSDGVIRKIVKK